MENNNWYDVFLENLFEIFPKKAQLTQELMTLLCLEREAVYRRLRNDVVFHAHEVIKIASTWNISLDEMIGINFGKVPFQMYPLNYLNPTKKEFSNLLRRVKALDHLLTTENSEYMDITNRLPRPLSIGFPSIYRFLIFKWVYQYSRNESHKQFSMIQVPDNIFKEFGHYKRNIVHVKNTHFILNQNIFESFVHSIKYFQSILLVTEEEKELLKKELFELIDYMSEIADKGYYPETQNKVNLYVSKINIDTNYSYIYTDKMKSCRVHAFGQYDIASFNLEMIENFMIWMNLKKKASIQISEANERSRIEFFVEQRKAVESL